MYFKNVTTLRGYGDVDAVEKHLAEIGFKPGERTKEPHRVYLILSSRDHGSPRGDRITLDIHSNMEFDDTVSNSLILGVVAELTLFLLSAPARPSTYLTTGKKNPSHGGFYVR